MRTCLVSRKKVAKDQLARFVTDPISKEFMLDEKAKIRSRGANLSLSVELFDKAVQIRAFERALKVKITPEQYESARNQFIQYIEKVNFRGKQKKVTIRVEGEKVRLD